MKNIPLILSTLICLFFSFNCTTEKTFFEVEEWWDYHWQQASDTSYFFSSGVKNIGRQEISTTQFFHSTRDSILDNYYVKKLEDFNHKKKWKLIKTSHDQYLKIQEIDNNTIEVFGPVDEIKDLDLIRYFYNRYPKHKTPPFPDSILYPDL